MSPCADSLFYFFTSYSHIRILSLRTPLIRFFQCRLVRIHCFTFSHRIPTFEFVLLGPRSLDFSNVALCGFIVLLFLQHIPTFDFFLLGPRSLDFSNVALCGFFVLLSLHHIPTFEFFLLGPRSLDFSNVALCGFIVLLFHIVFPHSNSFS